MRQSLRRGLATAGAIGVAAGLIYIYSNTTVFGDKSEPVTDPSDPIVEQLPEPEIEFDPVDIPLPGDPETKMGGSVYLDFTLNYSPEHDTAVITMNANETFYLFIGDLSKEADAKVEYPVVPWHQEGIQVFQINHILADDPCFGITVIRFKVQYDITGKFDGSPGCILKLNVTSKLLKVVEFLNSCPTTGLEQPNLHFIPVNAVLEFYPFTNPAVNLIERGMVKFGIRGLTAPKSAGCTK